jgi:3-methyladenine DNA glycosylase/8-oxoguanine DNA glycosylase
MTAEAWGPGAGWALDQAPELLGDHDDPAAFDPGDRRMRDLHRRNPGLRICRSKLVIESLVPAVLEQKVTAIEAHRSYRKLVLRYGEAAPGPRGLMLAPSPQTLAALPYYAFHLLSIERKRADTLRRVCSRAARLEEAAQMNAPDATRRVTALPGIGPWTAAIIVQVALGDPDAVIVGDYNFPHVVAWFLAGEARATDQRMLELLEPYRGHRARAMRLIFTASSRPPKFGPKYRLRDLARF